MPCVVIITEDGSRHADRIPATCPDLKGAADCLAIDLGYDCAADVVAWGYTLTEDPGAARLAYSAVRWCDGHPTNEGRALYGIGAE